jgi:hypothetical protein
MHIVYVSAYFGSREGIGPTYSFRMPKQEPNPAPGAKRANVAPAANSRWHFAWSPHYYRSLRVFFRTLVPEAEVNTCIQ